MFKAKTLILSNAPPEKRLIIPNILADSPSKNFFNTSIFIPGIGTKVPNLYINNIEMVRSIFLFKSVFGAFVSIL